MVRSAVLLTDSVFDEFVLEAVAAGAPEVGEAGGEDQTVEFLIVVKRFGVVHAGMGTSGVLERSATSLVTRSSLRFALRAFEIDRRAARTSDGI